MDFADAAALPVAGLTALRALREAGPLIGRRLLVTGATGGVGSFAVQLGAAAGAHVTALVSRPERADAARALGAHARALEAVAGGRRAVPRRARRRRRPRARRGHPRLAPRGTVIAYGVAGGAPQTPLAFFDFGGAPARAARRLLRLRHGRGDVRRGPRRACRLVADGRLRVDREVTRDWGETRDALQALRDRAVTGKVVLTL